MENLRQLFSGGFGKNDLTELKTGRYWEWGQGADPGPRAVRSEAASVDIWLPLLLWAPKPGHLRAAGVRQYTLHFTDPCAAHEWGGLVVELCFLHN